jgi:hypothetical protein
MRTWAREQQGYIGPQEKVCLICLKSFTSTKWNAWKVLTCSRVCSKRLDYLRHRTAYIKRSAERARANKEAVGAYFRDYRKAHALEVKARSVVGAAIRGGKLLRPSTCNRCGRSCKLEAHHHVGYDKPLEVQWLCKTCHMIIHHEIAAMREEFTTGSRKGELGVGLAAR